MADQTGEYERKETKLKYSPASPASFMLPRFLLLLEALLRHGLLPLLSATLSQGGLLYQSGMSTVRHPCIPCRNSSSASIRQSFQRACVHHRRAAETADRVLLEFFMPCLIVGADSDNDGIKFRKAFMTVSEIARFRCASRRHIFRVK